MDRGTRRKCAVDHGAHAVLAGFLGHLDDDPLGLFLHSSAHGFAEARILDFEKQTVVSMKKWPILALASGGFLSYLPVWLLPHRRTTGAGLVGSLWGVLLLKGLPLTPLRQILVWTGVLAISVAVSDAAEEILGHKDDQRIVIDEFIGVWTAILFL